MDEQVLGLVIGRDEAKALLVAEPLDGSGSHLRFLLRSLVLRAPRLLSKSYDRWHCDVGRITRPDLATVAAWSGALRSGNFSRWPGTATAAIASSSALGTV